MVTQSVQRAPSAAVFDMPSDLATTQARQVPAWIADLTLLTIVGAAVRAVPVLAADFPLSDGGMFAAMIGDLRASGFALPADTSYNGAGIPYAYPPLGFYLAAALEALTGIARSDLLRLVPATLSILSVPAFYLLARAVFGDRLRGALAAFFFAVLPLTFIGPLQGGGVTRALGQLLAILALWQVVRFVERPTWPRAGISGALLAAAALSHPGFALFAGLSSVVLAIARAGVRSGSLRVLQLGAVAAAVMSPWLITVVTSHGLAGVLGPGSLRHPLTIVLSALTLDFAPGPMVDVITPLALIGLAALVLRGSHAVPVWLAAVLLVDSWSRGLVSALPVAALAAAGLVDGLGLRVGPGRGQGPSVTLLGRGGRGAQVALASILGFALLGALLTTVSPSVPLRSLSAEHRQAQAWFAAQTPSSASAALVTGGVWWTDAASEWFPALSQRRSVATVQGYEWFGRERYRAQQDRYEELQRCGSQGIDCLRGWLASADEPIDYLYVSAGSAEDRCCGILVERLADGSLGEVVYRNRGVLIVRLASGGA